jgi:O-antigen/teichoic acid export membrane protein
MRGATLRARSGAVVQALAIPTHETACTNVPPVSDPETTSSSDGLGERVVSGARWIFLLRVTSIATLWLVSVVLAHLLERRQYGLAGMANIIVTLLVVFQDSGLTGALIHRSSKMREAIDAAVVYSAASGLALAAACVLAAPLVGDFFHQHQVTSLVRGLSLVFLFRSISQVPQAILQKELRFKAFALVLVSGSVLQASTAISLAALGAGSWSPIVGAIALEGWCALLMWPVAGIRANPRRASWSTLRELLGYGRGLAGANVAHTINQYVDNVVIARQLGPVQLGAYTIGYQAGKQTLTTLSFAASQLVFPAYTKLRDDLERFRRAYLRSLRFMAVCAAPLAFSLAAVSGTFVDAVYGSKWHDAAPVLTIIVLATLFSTLTASMGEVMKAMRHPGWVFGIATIQLILITVAVLTLYRHGIVAVAAGVGVATIAVGSISVVLTERLLRIGWREWLLTPLPAVCAGALTGIALFATDREIGQSAAIRLCFEIVEAPTVYLVALRVIAPEPCHEFLAEVGRLTALSKLRLRLRQAIRSN